MELSEAIRGRRAVRSYTDQPVDDAALDRVLRLALRAPTGGAAQAWGLLVVRDEAVRREVAELVIRGGATYFALMRPRADGADDEAHRAWAREYAESVMASYRHVPVFVVGLVVPRGYPADFPDGRDDDLMSLAFAFENLMLAARAEGLGTVPTTAFMRWEKPRLKELLGIPDDAEPEIITPVGHPTAFPTGLSPALARNRRPWRSLVHRDRYGVTG